MAKEEIVALYWRLKVYYNDTGHEEIGIFLPNYYEPKVGDSIFLEASGRIVRIEEIVRKP